MGRLLILLLIVVVIVLVWRAFGPGTWNRGGGDGAGGRAVGRGGNRGIGAGGGMAGGIGGFGRSGLARPEPQRPMGPDDDEDFLWKLDKQRFEEKRAREREEQRAAEERRAPRNWSAAPSASPAGRWPRRRR